MYNPKPLKVYGIQFKNRTGANNAAPASGVVRATNDMSTWTQLTSFTNSNQTAGASWVVTIPENVRGYYKYYQLYDTHGYSTYTYSSTGQINLLAYYNDGIDINYTNVWAAETEHKWCIKY